MDSLCDLNSPLEEAIAVAVNRVDGAVVGYRDVVGLNSNHLAILLVQVIDCLVSPSPATLIHQPQVCESCWQRAGNFQKTPVSEIRKQEIEDWKK